MLTISDIFRLIEKNNSFSREDKKIFEWNDFVNCNLVCNLHWS